MSWEVGIFLCLHLNSTYMEVYNVCYTSIKTKIFFKPQTNLTECGSLVGEVEGD